MKTFLITIDTEGDNLWGWDQNSPITTNNAKYLIRFQKLCNKYAFKPTYFVNYEMACDENFVQWARQEQDRGTCEIGMHLHAWNSPPDYPLTKAEPGLPFLIEYPDEILEQKVYYMTQLIEKKFGRRPTSHRAGRWAMDRRYFKVLGKENYIADCSVTPNKSWANQKGYSAGSHGSDYRSAGMTPGLVGDTGVIEIPFNSVFTHAPLCMPICSVRDWFKAIYFVLKGRTIQLRPNISNYKDLERFLSKTHNLEFQMFMLHSAEFMPGCNPTFNTSDSIEKLSEHLEKLFNALAVRGYVGEAVSEYAEHLKQKGLSQYEF